MKLLRVKKTHVYDVFIGDGWERWSRVLFQKNKTIHIGGSKLSSADHLTVHRQLRKVYSTTNAQQPNVSLTASELKIAA